MDLNPLSDIEARVKQQKLENELKTIYENVKFIKENLYMPKYIEVNTLITDTEQTSKFVKTTLNPDYIVSIIEDGGFTRIMMTNGTFLATESREEIMKLISDSSNMKTYIN